MKKNVIVSLADANYFPLLDELVDSIIESKIKELMFKLSEKKADAEECEAFIELLNEGQIRAAEKIQDNWEPQPYVIDGVLNYFGTHGNICMEGKYWDKIPLKTVNLW